MLVNKKAGVLVHEDISEKRDTLINQVLLYLYNKGEYNPDKEVSFTPSLCNRLDKNTGGIVIVAKNALSQRLLYDIVKTRQIKKMYLTLVHGVPNPKKATIYGYLKKDEKTNTVEVRDNKFSDAKEIITKYDVVESNGKLSLLDVELVTGRTHQIRAHLAHIGHPIVGDNKYGRMSKNKEFPFRHQTLYSYSLEFCIQDVQNPLAYLNGKIFCVKDIYFRDFLKK